jgi:hypothetical protein
MDLFNGLVGSDFNFGHSSIVRSRVEWRRIYNGITCISFAENNDRIIQSNTLFYRFCRYYQLEIDFN